MTEPVGAAPMSDESGWQPIETAPRNGVEIIGGWAAEQWVYAIWYRGEGREAGWWFANEGPGEYCGELICPQPSHWRPLPSPPPAPTQEGR